MFFSDDTQEISSTKPPQFKTRNSESIQIFDPRPTEKDDWIFVEEKKETGRIYLSTQHVSNTNFQMNSNPYLNSNSTFSSTVTYNPKSENQYQKKDNEMVDLYTKELPNFDFSYEKSIVQKSSFKTDKESELKPIDSRRLEDVNIYKKETIPQKLVINPQTEKRNQLFQKMFDKGYKEELIFFAIEVYPDEKSVESFLLNFDALKDFGFDHVKIKEALLLKDNQFDDALNFLTNEK
eukprot:gene8051-12513_t